MASNRDRLRTMSKKNTEAAKQLMDVPTLISDVAEREGEGDEIEVTPNNSSKVENKEEEIQINSVHNESESIKETEPISTENVSGLETKAVEPKDDCKTANDIQVEQIDNKNDIPEEPEPILQNIENNSSSDLQDTSISEDKDSLQGIPNSDVEVEELSLTEKYQGPEVIISLLLQEESNNYLTYKAMDLRISSKQLLKDLLIKELEKGYQEDSLCPLYRRTQHQTIKRSIVIDKQLKEDIQEAAIKYRMRYTAFISYVIYKTYINDSEYKELM